jgi:hypothetical protein
MSKSRKLPKRLPRPEWPAETRAEVSAWLRAKMAHLDKAIVSLKEGLKIADLDWIRKNIAYYEHAKSCIRWLLYSLNPKGPRGKKGGPDAEPESQRPSERGE